MLAVTLRWKSIHTGLSPASAENYKTKLLFAQESSTCGQCIIETLEMNCCLWKDKPLANFIILSARNDVKLNIFPFSFPTRLKSANYNSFSASKGDFLKNRKKRGL